MDQRERMRLYMASRYAALKAKGLCPRCGCDRKGPHVLCRPCRLTKAEWMSQHRELNDLAQQPSSRAS